MLFYLEKQKTKSYNCTSKKLEALCFVLISPVYSCKMKMCVCFKMENLKRLISS